MSTLNGPGTKSQDWHLAPNALVSMLPIAFDEHFDVARLATLAKTPDPLFVADLSAPGIDERLAQVEVLFTGWGTATLSSQILDRMPRLRAVLHCAGTVKGLVEADFWRRGIVLTNCVEQNARPVAQFALACIILAGKKALWPRRDLPGDWDEMVSVGGLGNNGITVGVVGFSRVGRQLVQLLRQTLDCTVLVYDPYADPAAVTAGGGQPSELDELLRASDVLTLHAPDTPETQRMIGRRELALLRDGACVFNTARGALIDHRALAAECGSGRLLAALDVTDPEPLPTDSVLRRLPNVALTPHVAGSLGNEIDLLCGAALDSLQALREGRTPADLVDPHVLEISA